MACFMEALLMKGWLILLIEVASYNSGCWFLNEKVRIFLKRFWMRCFHSLVKMLLISVIQVLCEFVILLGWEWVGNGRTWLNRRWQKWDFQKCPGLHFLGWEHGQDITISCLLVFSIFTWLLLFFFFPYLCLAGYIFVLFHIWRTCSYPNIGGYKIK